MKSCFFIGHSDAPEGLAPKLVEAIERHIVEFGVTSFIVGNYGRFDRMAQTALSQAKVRHPDILVRMGIAYLSAISRVRLPEEFDSVYFPAGQGRVPPRAAIPRLNRTLVDESDFLIAYIRHISSGSYKVLRYARKREQRGLIRVTVLED